MGIEPPYGSTRMPGRVSLRLIIALVIVILLTAAAVLYFTEWHDGLWVGHIEENDDSAVHLPSGAPGANRIDKFKPFLGTYIANFSQFVDEPFEVTVQNGRLALNIPSRALFELLGPDKKGLRYFATTDTAAVTFALDESGRADLLKLHQGGHTYEIPRADSARARQEAARAKINPHMAARLVGTYHDPEDDVFNKVFVEDDVLVLRLIGAARVQLLRTDEPLHFEFRQTPAMTATFTTNEVGKATSMTLRIGPSETKILPRIEDEDSEFDD